MKVSPFSAQISAKSGSSERKPVPRVHRVGAGAQRRLDHGGRREVRLARRPGPDLHGGVRRVHMAAVPVGRRVHGHGADTQLAAGPHDTDRDLAPVGHQDGAESHRHTPSSEPSAAVSSGSISTSGSPYSTGSPSPTSTSTTRPAPGGRQRVHQLHRLDDAELLALLHMVARLDEGGCAGRGSGVEGADERRALPVPLQDLLPGAPRGAGVAVRTEHGLRRRGGPFVVPLDLDAGGTERDPHPAGFVGPYADHFGEAPADVGQGQAAVVVVQAGERIVGLGARTVLGEFTHECLSVVRCLATCVRRDGAGPRRRRVEGAARPGPEGAVPAVVPGAFEWPAGHR